MAPGGQGLNVRYGTRRRPRPKSVFDVAPGGQALDICLIWPQEAKAQIYVWYGPRRPRPNISHSVWHGPRRPRPKYMFDNDNWYGSIRRPRPKYLFDMAPGGLSLYHLVTSNVWNNSLTDIQKRVLGSHVQSLYQCVSYSYVHYLMVMLEQSVLT